MALLGGAIAWANYARLDQVAVAGGEVVPQGRVKIIQHLEGGILERIHVAEGQKVSAGDPLVLLELGMTSANPKELQAQIDGLTLKQARLFAEANDGDPHYPAEAAARMPELLRSERAAFATRQRRVDGRLAVLEKQAQQRALEVKELEAKRATVAANLTITGKRLTISRDLLKSQLVSRMEHLELESEARSLEGELARLRSAIPRVRVSRAEIAEQKREATLEFKRLAAEELGQIELSLARIRELLAAAARQVQRAVVKAPIDGVVKSLRYHTISGVVRPGDPIMEIVPLGDNLVIEARLDPTDVGYVAAGQPAMVKVSAYEFMRYGGLAGEVVNVAADGSTDRLGKHFFKVIVRTNKSYLGARPGLLPIIPGMQATVDIRTGERSVLEYLITPVLKLKHEAFRER